MDSSKKVGIIAVSFLVVVLGVTTALVFRNQNVQEKAYDCVANCQATGKGLRVCECSCGIPNDRCPEGGGGDAPPAGSGGGSGCGVNTTSGSCGGCHSDGVSLCVWRNGACTVSSQSCLGTDPESSDNSCRGPDGEGGNEDDTGIFCAGCGGFCLDPTYTGGCDNAAAEKCGEVTSYTAPICDDTTQNAVVIGNYTDTEYAKCVNGIWQPCYDCVITQLSIVPDYLRPDYDLALEQARQEQERRDLAEEQLRLQLLEEAQAEQARLEQEARVLQEAQLERARYELWAQQQEEAQLERARYEIWAQLQEEAQLERARLEIALQLYASQPLSQIQEQSNNFTFFNSLAECNAAITAGAPVTPAECYKYGTDQEQLAIDYNLLNRASFGTFAPYVQAFHPDNVSYYWERNYESLNDCYEDLRGVIQPSGIPATGLCNQVDYTSEQLATSRNLGTAITLEGALLTTTGGLASGALTVPAAMSQGLAISTIYQSNRAVDACIADPGSRICWEETAYAGVSWLNVGTVANVFKLTAGSARVVSSAVNLVNLGTDIYASTQVCGVGEYASPAGCTIAVTATLLDAGSGVLDIASVISSARRVPVQYVDDTIPALNSGLSDTPSVAGIDELNDIIDVVPDQLDVFYINGIAYPMNPVDNLIPTPQLTLAEPVALIPANIGLIDSPGTAMVPYQRASELIALDQALIINMAIGGQTPNVLSPIPLFENSLSPIPRFNMGANNRIVYPPEFDVDNTRLANLIAEQTTPRSLEGLVIEQSLAEYIDIPSLIARPAHEGGITIRYNGITYPPVYTIEDAQALARRVTGVQTFVITPDMGIENSKLGVNTNLAESALSSSTGNQTIVAATTPRTISERFNTFLINAGDFIGRNISEPIAQFLFPPRSATRVFQTTTEPVVLNNQPVAPTRNFINNILSNSQLGDMAFGDPLQLQNIDVNPSRIDLDEVASVIIGDPDPKVRTAEQIDNLTRDVDAARRNISDFQLQVSKNGGSDPTRILGVVSAAGDANTLLPPTLNQMLDQLSASGKHGDIIVGFNHGFDGTDTVNTLRTRSDTEIIVVEAAPRPSATIPAQDFKISGSTFNITNTIEPDRHRIIFINQPQSAYSEGKIRMLGDIYNLVERSVQNGWRIPAYTLAFDAESRFLTYNPRGNPDLESKGLRDLINTVEADPTIDIMGTRNSFVVFNNGIPDYSIRTGPVQQVIDLTHGSPGTAWSPGGGTFGRTELITMILKTIATNQPSQRVEDVMTTILARASGFEVRVSPSVISTNNTPSSSNPEAVRSQLIRWIAGSASIEDIYGNILPVVTTVNPTMMNNIRTGTVKFVQHTFEQYGLRILPNIGRITINLIDLLRAIPEYAAIQKIAIANPDRPLDPDFRPSWITPGQSSDLPTSITTKSPIATHTVGGGTYELMEGDVVIDLPLIIDPAQDSSLRGYLSGLQEYVDLNTPRTLNDRVRLINDYVNGSLEFGDPNIVDLAQRRQSVYSQGSPTFLGQLIDEGIGVCLERAACVHVAMANNGISSYLARGETGGLSGHAWVEYFDSGARRWMVAEPNTPVVRTRDEMYSQYGGSRLSQVQRQVFVWPENTSLFQRLTGDVRNQPNRSILSPVHRFVNRNIFEPIRALVINATPINNPFPTTTLPIIEIRNSLLDLWNNVMSRFAIGGTGTGGPAPDIPSNIVLTREGQAHGFPANNRVNVNPFEDVWLDETSDWLISNTPKGQNIRDFFEDASRSLENRFPISPTPDELETRNSLIFSDQPQGINTGDIVACGILPVCFEKAVVLHVAGAKTGYVSRVASAFPTDGGTGHSWLEFETTDGAILVADDKNFFSVASQNTAYNYYRDFLNLDINDVKHSIYVLPAENPETVDFINRIRKQAADFRITDKLNEFTTELADRFGISDGPIASEVDQIIGVREDGTQFVAPGNLDDFDRAFKANIVNQPEFLGAREATEVANAFHQNQGEIIRVITDSGNAKVTIYRVDGELYAIKEPYNVGTFGPGGQQTQQNRASAGELAFLENYSHKPGDIEINVANTQYLLDIDTGKAISVQRYIEGSEPTDAEMRLIDDGLFNSDLTLQDINVRRNFVVKDGAAWIIDTEGIVVLNGELRDNYFLRKVYGDDYPLIFTSEEYNPDNDFFAMYRDDYVQPEVEIQVQPQNLLSNIPQNRFLDYLFAKIWGNKLNNINRYASYETIPIEKFNQLKAEGNIPDNWTVVHSNSPEWVSVNIDSEYNPYRLLLDHVQFSVSQGRTPVEAVSSLMVQKIGVRTEKDNLLISLNFKLNAQESLAGKVWCGEANCVQQAMIARQLLADLGVTDTKIVYITNWEFPFIHAVIATPEGSIEFGGDLIPLKVLERYLRIRNPTIGLLERFFRGIGSRPAISNDISERDILNFMADQNSSSDKLISDYLSLLKLEENYVAPPIRVDELELYEFQVEIIQLIMQRADTQQIIDLVNQTIESFGKVIPITIAPSGKLILNGECIGGVCGYKLSFENGVTTLKPTEIVIEGLNPNLVQNRLAVERWAIASAHELGHPIDLMKWRPTISGQAMERDFAPWLVKTEVNQFSLMYILAKLRNDYYTIDRLGPFLQRFGLENPDDLLNLWNISSAEALISTGASGVRFSTSESTNQLVKYIFKENIDTINSVEDLAIRMQADQIEIIRSLDYPPFSERFSNPQGYLDKLLDIAKREGVEIRINPNDLNVRQDRGVVYLTRLDPTNDKSISDFIHELTHAIYYKRQVILPIEIDDYRAYLMGLGDAVLVQKSLGDNFVEYVFGGFGVRGSAERYYRDLGVTEMPWLTTRQENIVTDVAKLTDSGQVDPKILRTTVYGYQTNEVEVLVKAIQENSLNYWAVPIVVQDGVAYLLNIRTNMPFDNTSLVVALQRLGRSVPYYRISLDMLRSIDPKLAETVEQIGRDTRNIQGLGKPFDENLPPVNNPRDFSSEDLVVNSPNSYTPVNPYITMSIVRLASLTATGITAFGIWCNQDEDCRNWAYNLVENWVIRIEDYFTFDIYGLGRRPSIETGPQPTVNPIPPHFPLQPWERENGPPAIPVTIPQQYELSPNLLDPTQAGSYNDLAAENARAISEAISLCQENNNYTAGTLADCFCMLEDGCNIAGSPADIVERQLATETLNDRTFIYTYLETTDNQSLLDCPWINYNLDARCIPGNSTEISSNPVQGFLWCPTRDPRDGLHPPITLEFEPGDILVYSQEVSDDNEGDLAICLDPSEDLLSCSTAEVDSGQVTFGLRDSSVSSFADNVQGVWRRVNPYENQSSCYNNRSSFNQ